MMLTLYYNSENAGMDGYQQPASIKLHYKISCEFDMAFLFSV